MLSPKEVAILLGLSTRNVYYLIDKGSLKASHLSTRITLIKRKDIDVMLDDNQEKRKRKSSQPITEFYTTSEILQKYGISESGLYKIAKCENFPKVFQHWQVLLEQEAYRRLLCQESRGRKHHGMVFCCKHKREVQHDYHGRLYFCF